MPEGDTVWRTAHRLDEVFAGRELARCDLRWPDIATVDLTGAPTVEVVARGKHILHRLLVPAASGPDARWTIHSHLRMDGQWRIERADASRRDNDPQIRAVLGTAEYTALGHRLGMLDVVPTENEDVLVGHLGPDVLGPDWDAAVAVAHLKADDAVIGAALIDQRNLAGVGTMWCAESLFAERINPFTPAADLDDAALTRLVERARRFIDANRAHAIPSSTGIRRHGQTTYAHGRRGKPCRRCGTPIRMEWAGPPAQERTMYFCPTCQPR
ncbi:DNA-formamidopyrimidine glycosylase family protein [Nigerium massiliense]|uniref:DNA-formamidopyrimidine glycosylase family protein n=1 Tax=Nigerium massiliense TaxID=1522317 RepID=UPI00058CCE9F|nr:DNA-formamidopyrimidine glycosylase family protein [Nigerium massiliense]